MLNQLLNHFFLYLRCQNMKNFFNHPTAIIDKNCVVGKSTKIWHWTHISESSIIEKIVLLVKMFL